MAAAAEVCEVNFYWAPLVKRSKSDTRNFRYLQEIKQNDRGSEIKLKFLVAAPDFSGGGLQPGSKGKGDGWEKSGKPKRNRASHKRWMVGKWGKEKGERQKESIYQLPTTKSFGQELDMRRGNVLGKKVRVQMLRDSQKTRNVKSSKTTGPEKK